MWVWWCILVGCGSPEPRLSCETPEAGDLQGYCVLGENHGRAAAQAALVDCHTGAAPSQVAEGPGGCEEVGDAVLDAEQAAYVRCWQAAWDEVMAPHLDDSGCVPEG